jgi:threonyl-tRNA synthetase
MEKKAKKAKVEKKPGVGIIRHSLAHVMALALQRIYKKVQYGIGPDTENGFYYDVLTKKPLATEDLEKIEIEMKKIIKENLVFSKFELTIAEGVNLFKKLEQKFKLELIEDLKKYGTTNAGEIEKLKELPKSKIKGAKNITVYTLGEKIKTKKDILKSKDVFVDLCKGPHIKSTGLIPESFKLTSVAGAYFRGSEKNKMLTRIYGISFENDSELKEYLSFLEEAEKRDHKKLGPALGIFFLDESAPGMPY